MAATTHEQFIAFVEDHIDVDDKGEGKGFVPTSDDLWERMRFSKIEAGEDDAGGRDFYHYAYLQLRIGSFTVDMWGVATGSDGSYDIGTPGSDSEIEYKPGDLEGQSEVERFMNYVQPLIEEGYGVDLPG